MRRIFSLILTLCMLLSLCTGCRKEIKEAEMEVYHTYDEREGDGVWTYGFGSAPIVAEGHADGTDLYIAGYNSGWYGSGYLDRRLMATYQMGKNRNDLPEDPDYSEARAVWIDAAANFKDYANDQAKIASDMKRIKETGFTSVVVDVRPTNSGVLFKSSTEAALTKVDAWVTGGYKWLQRTEKYDSCSFSGVPKRKEL